MTTDIYIPEPGDLRLGDTVAYGDQTGTIVEAPDPYRVPGRALDRDGHVWISSPRFTAGVCMNPAVVRLIKRAVSPAPELSDEERLARTVDCPYVYEGMPCAAVEGHPCVTLGGASKGKDRAYHSRRLDSARRSQREKPRTVLDVECPCCDEAKARKYLGRRPDDMTPMPVCTGRDGQPCTSLHDGEKLVVPHHPRRQLFASLAGQAPKDSTTPSGVVTPVGPEPEGDSGTGRAAGEGEGFGPKAEPAAPSGFPKCPGLSVRPGQFAKCGAVPTRGGTLCNDCRASVDVGHRSPDPKRRRAIDLLHHDLDRPLPKVKDAEKLWPEAWATPGWDGET